MGRVGEAVFFTAVLLLGIGGLVALFALQVIPQWRANHEFVAHPCRVLDTRVGQKETGDGTLYRPEIQIQYEINGRTYRTWTYDIWHYHLRDGYTADREHVEKVLGRFASNVTTATATVCWYDPMDPSVAILTRGTSWWVWVTFVVPAAFVLIGAGGLIYTISTWGKSAERRAATSKKGANGLQTRTNGRKPREYPYVPRESNITDSPGTKLAFRLPIASQRTWAMMVTLAACLLWNGIVAVFVAIIVRRFLRGDPDWLLTVFVLPFLALGVGLAVYVVRQFVLVTGVGPTILEISDQPLRPGQRYRVFLSQIGRLRLRSMEMFLVCEEETRYQQGTNTRTESRRVYEECVFHHAQSEVRPGLPLESDCDLEIPDGAMHSFKADHNEIKWKLVVKGNPEVWPDYERSFPVVVYPAGNGRKTTDQ
jgi:hypothetical protein